MKYPLEKATCIFFEYLTEKQFFKGYQHKIVQPPEYEIPACTMPHAGQEPDYEKVPVHKSAVAAQRYVNIVAENVLRDICHRRQNSVADFAMYG